jgi:hypothetical protein
MTGVQIRHCCQIMNGSRFATRSLLVPSSTEYHNYAIYCKPQIIFINIPFYLHSTRITLQYLQRACISSSDQATPIMDEIDTFFASFPTFQYRRNASSPQEFRRMCRFFGWKKDSNNIYPIGREEASANFRIAMVRTFNRKFGEGLEVKRAWLFLCTVLGVEPMPNTITELKEVS